MLPIDEGKRKRSGRPVYSASTFKSWNEIELKALLIESIEISWNTRFTNNRREENATRKKKSFRLHDPGGDDKPAVSLIEANQLYEPSLCNLDWAAYYINSSE